MMNPIELEQAFEEMVEHLPRYLPDGIVSVDLHFLQSIDLLHSDMSDSEEDEIEGSNHQFYVIETAEKLTLYNQEFVIWIIPQLIEKESATTVFIALNNTPRPHLEMAFVATGVFNTSRLVLGILNRLLNEIKENEDLIVRMEEKRKTGS